MNALIVLSTTLALLPAPARQQAAPASPEATAIVDKAVKALGGEEQLGKVHAATWKTAGTISFNGSENKMSSVVTVQGLDHERREFNGEFNGNTVHGLIVLAGDKGSRSFGDNHNDMDANGIANEKRSLYVTAIPMDPLVLKMPGYKLATVADDTVDGKLAAGLQVTAPDGKDLKVYFDKDSGLPVKLVAKVAGFGGMEFTQTTTYADYKDMGGIKVATKITSLRDGEKFLTQEVSDFKVLDTVDPKTFTDAS